MLIHAPGIAFRGPCVPLDQKLFDKLAHLVDILLSGRTYFNGGRRYSSHSLEIPAYCSSEIGIPESQIPHYSDAMRKTAFVSVAILIFASAFVSATSQLTRSPGQAAAITVSRAEFKQHIEDWSEPEGYFDTDNFISNETSYLHVIPELQRRVQPGGVYIGVGPDQNFSYIARTKPALAIIIDIRRQNMLQHLFLKALFDLSSSRAEYLARFFGREVPIVNPAAALPELLRAVRQTATSESLYRRDLLAVRQKLTEYGVPLSPDDLSKIEYVYSSFHLDGLDMRFSSIGRNNASQYPTFESLLLQTDRNGKMQNYLADEATFLWMKQFEADNRLIPIVGDFSGPHAFKAVGTFLAKNGWKVSTFYTSNVEYYLFGQSSWQMYVQNVRALPMLSNAVFIRAYFSSAGPVHPQAVPGHRSTSLVQDVAAFLADEKAGRIRQYWDVVK